MSKTLSDLIEKTSASNNDVLLIEDINSTSKITKENFLKEVNEQFISIEQDFNSQLEQKAENDLVIATYNADIKNRNNMNVMSYTGEGGIVITDDGLRKKFLTHLKPFLDEHGIKVSIGAEICHIGADDERATWEDLQQLYKEGHEIMSHSVNHPSFAQSSNNIIDYELIDSKKQLAEKGIKVKNFIYPYNETNHYSLTNVLKYYRSAVGLGDGQTIKPPIKHEMIPRTGLGVYQIYSNSQLKEKCLNAYNNGEFLVFMTHCGFEEGAYKGDILINNIIEVLQYCIDNNIPIVTLDEALDRVGNISQIGTMTEGLYEIIGADKKKYSTLGLNESIIRISPNDIADSKPPSFYNKYITTNNLKEIKCLIDDWSLNNPNIPIPSMGVLITYKNSQSGWMDKQEFHVYQSNIVYERFGIDTSTWSEWMLRSAIPRLKITDMSINRPPSYFNKFINSEKTAILKLVIGDADKSNVNLPIVSTGILTIEKNTISNGFDRQLFTPQNTSNVYARYSISASDSWTAWKNISNPTGYRSARPTENLVIGQFYFDQTILKPIWWKGDAWILADGTISPNS